MGTHHGLAIVSVPQPSRLRAPTARGCVPLALGSLRGDVPPSDAAVLRVSRIVAVGAAAARGQRGLRPEACCSVCWGSGHLLARVQAWLRSARTLPTHPHLRRPSVDRVQQSGANLDLRRERAHGRHRGRDPARDVGAPRPDLPARAAARAGRGLVCGPWPRARRRLLGALQGPTFSGRVVPSPPVDVPAVAAQPLPDPALLGNNAGPQEMALISRTKTALPGAAVGTAAWAEVSATTADTQQEAVRLCQTATAARTTQVSLPLRGAAHLHKVVLRSALGLRPTAEHEEGQTTVLETVQPVPVHVARPLQAALSAASRPESRWNAAVPAALAGTVPAQPQSVVGRRAPPASGRWRRRAGGPAASGCSSTARPAASWGGAGGRTRRSAGAGRRRRSRR